MTKEGEFEKCIKFIKMGCFIFSLKNFLKLPTGKVIFIVFFTTRVINSFVVVVFSAEAQDISVMVYCHVPKSSSKPISYAE